MRLSTRGRYSLKMMVDIARNGAQGSPVSLITISQRTRISHGYLEQLALSLRRAGLLRGVAGRRGGYLLARPAREINVRNVIEAAVGPVNLVDCVDGPEKCPTGEDCECRLVFDLITRRVTETMEEISLADLADRDWQHRIRARSGNLLATIER